MMRAARLAARAGYRALARSRTMLAYGAQMRRIGTVFVLHRFTDPERGSRGHDPNLLRRHLSALRKAHREIVSVAELLRRCQEDPGTVAGAIAFTVDDGYADFAAVAAPIFADFHCPVTVFLVTGVIDGQSWFWVGYETRAGR